MSGKRVLHMRHAALSSQMHLLKFMKTNKVCVLGAPHKLSRKKTSISSKLEFFVVYMAFLAAGIFVSLFKKCCCSTFLKLLFENDAVNVSRRHQASGVE